jgi:phage minor structural protein, N-terminal domain protein
LEVQNLIYLTNGNTPLNAAYADKISQEANSTYQLTFHFPTSDALWEKLKEEAFLKADDLHGEQDFVIFEVQKKHGYIQVYANQSFTLLNNYVINPISLDKATGSTALSRFAGSITRENPFSFFSDIDERHTFNTDSVNAMVAFTKDKHSILGQWGGDLVRHGYQVQLLKNGGSENESLFMYKKNLSSYQQKTSTKSLKTRITFKTTVKGEGEKAPDRKFSVVVDSPLINKYSQIYEDVIEVNDQDVKDEAGLRKYGEQYFRTTLCDMLEDSLEIQVEGKSDVPVQIFDVVSLFHDRFKMDVRKKITKYTYSPMAKKLLSIGFGKFKSGLSNMLSNAVNDAVKNETQHLQGQFATQLAKEIKNADLAFDRKKEELTNQFTDEVNAIKAKAEENKRALSEEINRRFQDFSPAGFEEIKRNSEEALKQAGTSSDLAEQVKGLVDTTRQNLDTFKSQVYNNFVTDNQLRSDLSTVQTELKKYVKEETDEKTSAIRETITNGFVAKSTYLENVEGINQRFETIKRDNEAKLADYKQGIDGRFANIASQMAGKVNQIDFQRVRETSQLYERILGGAENDVSNNVSRLVMSNQVFQTEVGKYVTDDNNLIVNSLAMDKNTLIGNNNPKATVSVNDGIFTIKAQGLTGYNWSGFTLPIYVKKIYKDETYTLGFKYRIKEYPDSTFAFNVKNHGLNKTLLSSDIGKDRPALNKWQEFQKTFTVQEDFDFGNDGNYPFYIFLAKNGWIEFKEPILVRGSKTGPYKPSQFDDAYKMTEATRTQVTQLAGSYAIKNLNSAGDIINGINFAANGNNRIIGRATHISGETLIDNAVIKSAMIDKLKTANFEAGSVTTNILGAEAVTAEKVKFDTAFIQRLVSQQAFINELFAKQATITKIQSIDFTGNHIKGGRISSLNGQTTFDLQSGWLDMNQPGIGIRNKFAGRPLQYLVFGQGAIHGKDGSYTALMSNSNNRMAMDDGSAGIQIWNTNDNTTALNVYSDRIDFMYNATDPLSIGIDTIANTIENVSDIGLKGRSLVELFHLIDKNFKGIEDHFKYNNLGAPGYYRTNI